MTLNGRYALLQKRCVFEAYYKNVNEDRPVLSAAKNVGQWLYYLGYKVYADISRGSQGRGRKTTVHGIVENGNFQRFGWLFFRNFRDEASSDMQSIVSFSVIPKCITLNDLKSLFRVKFCFRAGLTPTPRHFSQDQDTKNAPRDRIKS